MEKVLSIIIPTYNMEKYLRRCLGSLIVSDENMNLLEVLVINDGSSDSSSSIGHAYELKYPQTIRVIDKENGNYGSCVNRGLKEITGKYVRILDADDYYHTENLDRFISMLKDSDADLVLSDMVSVYADGSKIRHSFDIDFGVIHDTTLFANNEFKNNLEMHQVTYKKVMLDTVGYQQTEGISYTDQEWTFYPMIGVDTVVYFPQVIYQYMLDRGGQTMDMEVELKCVGHKMVIARRMIDFMKDMHSINPSRENYVKCRFGRFLRLIYKLVLLYQTEEQYLLHLEELNSLDHKLKNDLPLFYEEMNAFVISSEVPLRFVKYWRKNHRRYPLLLLKMNKSLKQLDVYLRKHHFRK